MPHFSSPLTLCCRACGWKYTTPGPVGDCRLPGLNHFSVCPRCGGEVESHRAGLLDVLKAQVGQALGKRH